MDQLLLPVCSERCYHDPEVFRPIGDDASVDTKETVCVARQTGRTVVSVRTSKIGIAKTESHCL